MLRKLTLCVALFLGLAVASGAQLRFGAGAGYSTAGKYNAGVAAQLSLIGGLSLQSGLNFQTKEIKVDGTTTDYSYLEVPVQLQWGMDLVMVRPYLLGEYFFGYRTSHSGSASEGKGFENGAALGGGVDLWKLQLSAKYFVNFAKVDGKRMRGVNLSVIWFF